MAIVFWLGLAAGARLGAGAAWACLAASLAFAWLAHRAPPRTGAAAIALAAGLAGAARGAACDLRHAAACAALPPGDAFVRLTGTLESPAQRDADPPRAVVRVVAATPALRR